MMNTDKQPLEELSIAELYNGESSTYEVPIYQRNYAWEEDEIKTLVQDVYDAYQIHKKSYYIGTLVTFDKGERVYEVIDGQQRLTTIFLILHALNIKLKNKLTYRARQNSKETIEHIDTLNEVEEKDRGIVNGIEYAKQSIKDIIDSLDLSNFINYFIHNVHIVRYMVPKDVDLNHYFEVMNSRGEQLEKHEIVKANLSSNLRRISEKDFITFNQIWEICSEMNIYVQQKYPEESVFGRDLSKFSAKDFDSLPSQKYSVEMKSIKQLMNGTVEELNEDKKNDKNDSFQPIIDFPNFLLIVLKITRMEEPDFNPIDFTLDDKELINEFDRVKASPEFAKKFAFNLLKAKYLLDNYIVHHIDDKDKPGDNPWQLQCYFKEKDSNKPKNLSSENKQLQDELVHLLSMFEVSFTPHQRKNYLFYCLLHLFNDMNLVRYLKFLQILANKYFYDVYLNSSSLNETNNRPKPNSFDYSILNENIIDMKISNVTSNFNDIYGDGSQITKGIQLYVFNFMDYKIWKLYAEKLRGRKFKKGDRDRVEFFDKLGCSDFDLNIFDDFYFSRTRRSLEHFYPQNKAGENKTLSYPKINCFGNFAMIGAEANSSGSDWDPKQKLDHYSDRKTDPISVASLKFKIMLQICDDNRKKMEFEQIDRESGLEWNFEDIKEHQEKMVSILNQD